MSKVMEEKEVVKKQSSKKGSEKHVLLMMPVDCSVVRVQGI